MDEIRQASLGAAVARSPEVADGGAKWGRLILSVGLSALEPYPRSVISGFGAIMTSRPFSRCLLRLPRRRRLLPVQDVV